MATSLLSSANLERLLVEMPRTLTGFAPLGYVLLVMLGAGIAERTGLFGAAMRSVVRMAPARLLTPIVLFAGHGQPGGRRSVRDHAPAGRRAYVAAPDVIRCSASRSPSPASPVDSRPTCFRADSTHCCSA